MSNESELLFHFDFAIDDPAKRAAISKALERELAALPNAAGTRVVGPARVFDPAQVVTTIGVAVALINVASEGLEVLRKFVKSCRELASEIEGVKEARIVVGGKSVALATISDEELARVVAEARG